jgi:hypothetical protein
VIGPFLMMEGLCGFSKMVANFGIIGGHARQLWEVENTGWEG